MFQPYCFGLIRLAVPSQVLRQRSRPAMYALEWATFTDSALASINLSVCVVSLWWLPRKVYYKSVQQKCIDMSYKLTRVPHKSALQCLRISLLLSLKGQAGVSYKSAPHNTDGQECLKSVSDKSVLQVCLATVSHKGVPQECPTTLSNKSAFARVLYMSAPQV